jgi:hypothetical protein
MSTVIAQRRARSTRRVVILLGLVVTALLANIAYFLATSGTVPGPKIVPPPGTPSTGAGVVKVTPMTSTVTRSNGGAQLTAGLTLAKITLAASAVNGARITVAWTNVGTAAAVLGNPNAQISVGLYYAIHTTSCTATSGTKVVDPYVNLKISTTTYCLELATGTKGKFTSTAGELLLADNQVEGYMITRGLPQATTAVRTSLLAQCSATTTSWCQVATITTASSRVLYVVASIVNPGNTPKGQQAQLTHLTFYIHGNSAFSY